MYERRSEPLLPTRLFLWRLGRQLGLGAILIAFSLGLGTSGYHFLNGAAWIDSFVDAAMIMAGMGQVNPLGGTAGKLFAACYALYCGVVFILVSGLLLGPFFHRVLHRFHIEAGAEESDGPGAPRRHRK
jgi:hypothetical protein